MAAAPNATAASRVWLAAETHSALTAFVPSDPEFATAASAHLAVTNDVSVAVSAPLMSAGHLAGPRQRDVLQFNVTFGHGALRVGLTARNGRTGRALWARRVGSASDLVLPLGFTGLGFSSARGLLVGDFSTTRQSPGHVTMRVTIQAWSGRTGQVLWSSKPVTGTVVTAGGKQTETDVPGFAAVLHALPGRPRDALIPTESGTFAANDPEDGPGSASAVLVSGADGTTTSPYPTFTSSVEPPTIEPVPDLSGDGLADVLAMVPGAEGMITALHGNTGATIWSDPQKVGEFQQVKAVGRLSGGRVPDLVIEGQQLTLLRGSDGFLLWTRGGFVDNVIGLGPVRPGHAQAVAIISAFGRGEGSSDGTGSESAVVDIRAVTAADHVVWHRRVTATIRTTSHGPHTILEVGDANRIGDVQPDGTVDLAARVLIRAGKVHIQKAGIVSGRTGAFRAGPVETAASGSLVRGPGTDLIRVVASSAGIDVSGYDGVTGDRVMRRVVTTPGHVRHPFAAGLRVTGHACSDIETGGIFRRGREVVDLVSASGAPLWSLRFGKHQLTGGHVIRYPDPKHFCAG